MLDESHVTFVKEEQGEKKFGRGGKLLLTNLYNKFFIQLILDIVK